MKRILFVAFAIVSIVGASLAKEKNSRLDLSFANYTSQLRKAAAQSPRQWRTGNAVQQSEPATDPSGLLPKTDKWGTLYTPEGVEWMYTADLIQEISNYIPADENGGFELIEYSIVGATFTIYNEEMAQIAQFDVTIPEQDENVEEGKKETAINDIQLSPVLTRKFFNVSDAYEVMVYVHATTEDHTGHNYTMIYSINDPTKGTYLVTTIEGYHIGGLNLPKDPFDETFTLVFMREEFVPYETEDEDEDDEYGYGGDYYLYFDVYHKACWYDSIFPDMEFSMEEPTLMHTFSVDYKYFSGAGDYAMPILVSQYGNRMVYALPRYEKEFFVSLSDGLADGSYTDLMDYFENPVVSPDNHFLIDLYNYKFEKIGTTSIDMTTKEGFFWSFPGMGVLSRNSDIVYGYNGSQSDKPFYIIGLENYVTSGDEFWMDFNVYDFEGNKVGSIIEDAADYIALSDIPGEETQYCFYKVTPESSDFIMVDVPTGTVKATIPTTINDASISTSIDRAKIGDEIKYISSLTTAETDAEGNALHPIAWFKEDGALERIEKVNLGQNVAIALPYINAEALNPFIFNTDSQIEYMFLVKIYKQAGSSGSDEYLRILSQSGDVLLEVGADADGMPLNSIFLLNLGTSEAKLIVTYYADNKFKISYYDLPLAKYAGGTGSAEDPFQIANEGDLMSIALCPTSHFVIVNDIDFKGYEWQGNDCYFAGTLDGQSHVITNLNLSGDGIFNNLVDGAVIKNFSVVNAQASGTSFVVGNAFGIRLSETTTKPSEIINVHVYNSEAFASSSFGGIVNHTSNYVNVTGCSVNHTTIECLDGIAGGIVAESGPGTQIKACYTNGDIEGEIAGGICGYSLNADTGISNCHSSMNVCGSLIAGGIIGQSSRTVIKDCLADGEITSIGAVYSEYNHTSTQSNAGGIVGWLNTYLPNAHSTAIVVDNCIVASPKIEATSGVDTSIAHRIVGSTSQERLEPDPDGNVNPDGSYILVPGDAEPYIGNNYVLGALAAGNESMNTGEANTLEGKSVEFGDELVATLAWTTGETLETPWTQLESTYCLYYETEPRGLAVDMESVDVYGDLPATVTFFILGNADANDLAFNLDNEEAAKIYSISYEGNTAIVEIEYVSKGSATLSASYGAYTAACAVNAAGISSGIEDAITDKASAMEYVDGKIMASGTRISIYDMNGRRVASGFDSLDTNMLAKGVYIAKSSNGEVLKIAVR